MVYIDTNTRFCIELFDNDSGPVVLLIDKD